MNSNLKNFGALKNISALKIPSAFKNISTLAALLLPLTAQATNGYFTHGVGVRSQGMAGVGYALAQDSLAAATNPAALTQLGDQLDLGVTWFQPKRSAVIRGNPMLSGEFDANSDRYFWIPELGLSYQANERLSYGLVMHANGGMNTGYTQNPFDPSGNSGQAGVDLAQLFVTGAVAYQLTEAHALGLGVTYSYQMFEATGLAGFAGISSAPDALTNRGHDSSDGWGIKLGWQGQLTDQLTLAASWSSKIKMDNFEEYRGLFAQAGGFDIPQTYGLGFAWQLQPNWILAGDWQFIEYSQIKSIANPLAVQAPLGASNSPGFGWQDVNVYKLGVIHTLSPEWTLRAGYSYADQPIPASETFFNILAPGVIQEHLSLGASWSPTEQHALTLAYTRAFKTTRSGNQSIPTNFGGGEADLTMSQDILGLAWQYRF
ncbi:OmpP1/FadL family transporter [Nitrincola tapanii]|uniref:OmpP1/FadL family transporter n=1 Tax=Nitrincola tapanii TaxID=1708751 RepID=UPI00190F312D|nr:outer membrane protein transport protein [Nitrincola tapanii]